MKYCIIFFALLLTLAVSGAGEIEVSLYPERAAVGDRIEFTLTVNSGDEPRYSLPELANGRWLDNFTGRSYSNFNGKISVSRTIPVLATAEGTLTVPSFEVTLNGKKFQTAPCSVTILPADEVPVSAANEAEPLTLADAAFGRITLPEKRRTFYVGEEIPLDLKLYLRNGIQARPAAYPALSGLGNVLFHDFSAVNPAERKFGRPYPRTAVIGDAAYTVIVFPTAFTPTVSGKITPGAQTTVAIADNSRRNRRTSMFDDDFFDGFFSRQQMKSYVIDFQPGPALEIKPLPPVPAGNFYLGLIGSWQFAARLDRSAAKAGEPVTLTIEATGTGSPEMVNAPRFEFPGFRSYPPEIEKNKNGTENRLEIRYVLIPLQEGEKTLGFTLAAFDPVAGKYRAGSFELKLPVAPGAAPAAAVSASALMPEQDTAEPEIPAAPREELFYQKKDAGKYVALPLFRNHAAWILCAFFGAPAAAFLLWKHERKKERFKNDPAFAGRRKLLQERNQLLRRLKQKNDPETLQELVRQSLPMLAEYYRLPHGASAGEIAVSVNDPELKALLASQETASFQGGAADSAPVSAGALKTLCRILKKLPLLLVLLALPCSGGNEAFNRGDYKAAEEAYLARNQASGATSPNLLYNLGGVKFQQGDLPMARYYYSRAQLLNPRDAETLENLNLVNRKLLQPETGSTATPLELLIYCRDRFRPDEYLFFAAAAWTLFWLAAGFRRRLPATAFRTVAVIAGAVILLAATAAVSQCTTRYSSANAIITGKDLPLRSLPTAASGKIEVTVPGGSSGRILDTRDGWVRIEVNGRDGWVPSDRIKIILPEGLF